MPPKIKIFYFSSSINSKVAMQLTIEDIVKGPLGIKFKIVESKKMNI